MDLNFITELVRPADTKIVLLVMDGLGGLPVAPGGQTELETAHTPHLDRLAQAGNCGLHYPAGPGITCGSGPGHLALFGYDPLAYPVGRGVMTALGNGFDLQPGDVAARGNFCTIDAAGCILDRRAGRVTTERNRELTALLRREVRLPGAEVFIETARDFRLLLVLRGEGLSDHIVEPDPQGVGRPIREPAPRSPAAEKTSRLVSDFMQQARAALAGQYPANMVLLRGFGQRPELPDFGATFGLRAAAIAAYPMYLGAARLVGMHTLPVANDFPALFDALEQHWAEYDYFFVHVKPTDSAGEDGDFERKVALIEAVDALIPRLAALQPDVIIVTGDHSSPAALAAHSWHPVPVLLWSPHCRPDGVERFGERACVAGSLGPSLPATHLMPLALAHALRLNKFGA